MVVAPGPEIGLLLRLAHQRAAKTFAAALQPLGIDGRLYGVLSALDRLGPATQARLTVALDSDKSAMLRTVDELEQHGLVVRTPVPGDRRARTIDLTDEGRDRLAEASRVAQRVARDLLDGMTLKEQTTLRDLLARFVRAEKEDPPA